MSPGDRWVLELERDPTWAPRLRTVHLADHPDGGKAWVVVWPIPADYLERVIDLAPVALNAMMSTLGEIMAGIEKEEAVLREKRNDH